jgi:perosamine synthetase
VTIRRGPGPTPVDPAPPLPRRPWRRRHLSLLGGTTTREDVARALAHLLRADDLLEGPAIAEYEAAFAERIGVAHAISFSSGRVGLYGILGALGVGAGDEVLVPLPTHVVVPNAVRYTGATPTYVDCRPTDWNVDLAAAERRITPATKALLVQHTFGVPADVDAAAALAARHGLTMIEDCVHALGARVDGRPVGSFGRAAFFSTEETKIISSTMGGMVVTDDNELAATLRAFQARCAWPGRTLVRGYLAKFVVYWLLTQPNVHAAARALYELVGRRHPLPTPTTREELRGERPPTYEMRLSNAQAAIALGQLRRLDENLAHRAAIARAYAERLQGVLRTAHVPDGVDAAFVRYPVWVDDRVAAVRRASRHVVLGEWFTSVMEEAVDPVAIGYEPGSCPIAEAAARHLVNLPTHPRVHPDDVETLVRAVTDG